MDLDTDASKIRSSLIYISIVIILWYIAGGSIEKNAGIFGGGVKFAEPVWLEYTGIAIFLYLLRRYMLIFRRSRYVFQIAMMLEISADARFQRFAKNILLRSDQNISESVETRISVSWATLRDSFYQGDWKDGTRTGSAPPISLDSFFWPTSIFFNRSTSSMDYRNANNNRLMGEKGLFFKLRFLDRFIAIFYVVSAFVRTAFRSEEFYEVIMPVILSAVVFMVVVVFHAGEVWQW